MKFFVIYFLRYRDSFSLLFIFFLSIFVPLSAQNMYFSQKTSSFEEGNESITLSEDKKFLMQQNTNSDTQYSTEEENFSILDQEEEDGTVIQPIGIWDTVRVFIVLAIVILGIYVLVWALKKFQIRSLKHSEIIDICASQQLSGGGSVHLIKLGNSLFFIGTSNQNVTLIKEICDKEEIDEIDLSLSVVESEDENTRNSFYQKVRHIFRKGEKKMFYSKNKNSHKNNVVQDTLEIIRSMFRKPAKRGRELDA